MLLSTVDLRLLRVFVTIVEAGGFSAAQSKLNVSQPTLSSQIKALEERLRCKLCFRGRRGFKLKATYRLLASMDGFDTEISNLHAKLSGALRIGLMDNMAPALNEIVSQSIALFDQRKHVVQIRLVTTSPTEIEQRLLSETLDIGIACYPRFLKALSYDPIAQENNYLYVGRKHRLWNVNDQEFGLQVAPTERVAVRDFWPSFEMERLRMDSPAALVNNLEGQLQLLLSGGYIGYLPDHYAAPSVERGELRALNPDGISFTEPVHLVTRHPSTHSKPVAAFLSDLRSLVKKAAKR
mgnify:CR=1 FL=1